MKVGDEVTSYPLGSGLPIKGRITDETKQHWIVRFIFRNKNGEIENQYERKYSKKNSKEVGCTKWNAVYIREN